MKYTINGVEYPSVTTIIGLLDKSSALMPWAVNNALQYVKDNLTKDSDIDELLIKAKKEYRNVSKEAMDIGSEIHNLIEQYIKNGRDAVGKLRPEVENGFIAFLEWEKDNIKEWIESEMPIVDKTAGYAGTLDAIAKMKNGRIMCIDFKSSKGFYEGYDMQITAYKYARQQMHGVYKIKGHTGNFDLTYKKIIIDGCGVLRLDKLTGFPEWKDYSKIEYKAYQSFLCLTEYYYWSKKRKLKNNGRVI